MPGVNVSTIRSSGGDFSLLSSWESAVQGNLTTRQSWGASSFVGLPFTVGETLNFSPSGATATYVEDDGSTTLRFDVVTGTPTTADTVTGATSGASCTLGTSNYTDGCVEVAECYDDWPSGLSDSLTIDGSTTSATCYFKLTVPEGHRHNGTPRSGFYITNSTSFGKGIVSNDQYCVLEFLNVYLTGGTSDGFTVSNNNMYVTLVSCISEAIRYAFSFQNGDSAYNCIGIGGTAAFRTAAARTPYLYNCVAANSGSGFLLDGAVVKNSVAYNCTTDYSGTFNAASTNNATSAATTTNVPGANPVANIASSDFVDAANDDFHLASGSALIGAGTNLYSDFTTDIDGDTWPSAGAWDIGVDYYTGGAAAASLPPDASSRRFTHMMVR